MDKPMIGVLALVDYDRESYWMLPGYMQGIIEAGGLPVMLPLTVDAEMIRQIAETFDGFLLTGGQDVSPELYGAGRLEVCGETSDIRDRMEVRLFRQAYEMDKPMLGICRGIQFVNAVMGGTLWQDLPSQRPGMVEHHQSPPYDEPVHSVTVIEGSPLDKLLDGMDGESAVADAAKPTGAVVDVAKMAKPMAAAVGVVVAVSAAEAAKQKEMVKPTAAGAAEMAKPTEAAEGVVAAVGVEETTKPKSAVVDAAKMAKPTEAAEASVAEVSATETAKPTDAVGETNVADAKAKTETAEKVVTVAGTETDEMPGEEAPMGMRGKNNPDNDSAEYDLPNLVLHAKRRLMVNSYHHQAVRETAPGLSVMAVSEDGLVEGVWDRSRRFLWAVQWHPEFSFRKDESSLRIFRAFVEACEGLRRQV